MNIHPELTSIRAIKLPQSAWALGAMQKFLAAVNVLHRRKFKAHFTRTTIPSTDGYPVPTLLIRPEQLRTPAPALVYYHGGAFVMKPSPMHLENALRYAREAQCIVVFVEYRLAPKHRFPAGFNDCYAALRWTLANAEQLGVDKQRIVVGGDSAGGAMAAGVTQRALQEDRISLKGQLLIYPVVDLLCTRPSASAYASVPPFKELSPPVIATAYLGHASQAQVPRYASPIYGDVSGLPPAFIETAEFDPLHDQGVDYMRALQSKGVEVEWNEIKGGVHGFDLLAAKSSVTQDAMRKRIAFLRKMFAS